MNSKRMRKLLPGRSALSVAGRILLAALLLSLSVKPSWCAPKDDGWNFTTPAQMEKAIPKYLDNPRATYYVIMRARHRNLVDRAALLYGNLLKTRHGRNEFYVMSAYAFSHFMAVGPLAREHFVQHGSPTVEKLRRQALEADFYRKEAMEGKPNSPEVLLMSALPAFYMATNRSAKMKALNQVRRAVKLASSAASAPVLIVDFYHACEHLKRGCDAIWGEGSARGQAEFARLKTLLKEADAGAERIIGSFQYHRSRVPPQRRARVQAELTYFRNQRARMDYASYQRDKLPIASGVMEAACKTFSDAAAQTLWYGMEPGRGPSHLDFAQRDPEWALCPSLASARGPVQTDCDRAYRRGTCGVKNGRLK